MRVAQCWDDGVVDDIRLIEILRRYGARASFNISFGLHEEKRTTRWSYEGIKPVYQLARSELLSVYEGFPVANHCYRHGPLARIPFEEARREVFEGKDALEQHFGYEVKGFAYPGGSYNKETAELVREAGHLYGRTIHMVDQVFPPEDPILFHPNCDYKDPLFWDKYEHAKANDDIFYFMGHAYQLVTEAHWEAFERQIARLAQESVTWVDLPSLFEKSDAAQPDRR